MKRSFQSGMALLLAGIMAASAAGCSASAPGGAASAGSAASNSGAASGQEVVIKYPTYRVGTQVSAKAEKKIIDGFNEKYKGKIKLDVEELPSDQSYTEKMKVLAASNALPDVVEGKDGVLELGIRNGQAIDLTSYVNADPDYKKVIGQEAIDANTRDGKLYSISDGRQLIGYFYNKDLFAKAGISPAKTWDEFMSNCQKLSDKGITPISMMTGENCWTTNLLLSSMIGTANDAGNTFMKTKYPTSYDTPEVKAALEKVKTILGKYTTKDALGAKYDIAANHFLQENTAMICNGTWMTADFSNTDKAVKGLENKIGVALYPNDGIFAQYGIGYMLCSADKAKQDAAFEFIKYKTNAETQKIMLEDSGTVPLTNAVKMSDEYKKANPLMAQLIDMSSSAKYKYNSFDQISYSSVIEEMSKDYPSLSMGDMSVDDMVKAMTAAAAKNK